MMESTERRAARIQAQRITYNGVPDNFSIAYSSGDGTKVRFLDDRNHHITEISRERFIAWLHENLEVGQ